MSSRPFPSSPRRGSFLASLAVQSRVIGALILRELHTRYGRENIGYLWMIGEPMLLATVIGIMHGSSGHNVYGADLKPVPFGVLGYTCFILFRGVVNRSEGGIEANGPLLYHRQVTILDITIARALLEFAGCFLTFVILMTLLIGLGLADIPPRPLVVIGAWMLMLWYCFGHSLIVTSISYENRTVGRLVHPYSYFMTGLSGAFIPIHWLPHPYREWLTYVPLTSVFELLRYGWFRSTNLDYFYPTYLVGACLVLTWVGMVCVSTMRDRIHLS